MGGLKFVGAYFPQNRVMELSIIIKIIILQQYLSPLFVEMLFVLKKRF